MTSGLRPLLAGFPRGVMSHFPGAPETLPLASRGASAWRWTPPPAAAPRPSAGSRSRPSRGGRRPPAPRCPGPEAITRRETTRRVRCPARGMRPKKEAQTTTGQRARKPLLFPSVCDLCGIQRTVILHWKPCSKNRHVEKCAPGFCANSLTPWATPRVALDRESLQEKDHFHDLPGTLYRMLVEGRVRISTSSQVLS